MLQLVIYGRTGMETTKDSGMFECPVCGPHTPYTHKGVQVYFTLYFIPLFPMWTAGEWIECGNCKVEYETEVLNMAGQFNREPEQIAAPSEPEPFYEEVKRVQILMAMADGGVDENEKREILAAYKLASGWDLDDGQLQNEIQMAAYAGVDCATYASTLAPKLNDHGKAAVAQAAYRISVAGGQVVEAKKQQLLLLPSALGVTPTQFKEMVRQGG